MSKEAYHLLPGHQQTAQLELDSLAQTVSGGYCLEPISTVTVLVIAHTFGTHSNQVCQTQALNVVQHPTSIPAGAMIGRAIPLHNKESPVVNNNNFAFPHVDNVALSELLPKFQPHLDNMDINPDLAKDEQEQMRQVIQDNIHAFAFGSKKLGRTKMVTMTLDTGGSKPISSAPYTTPLQLEGRSWTRPWRN